MSLHWASVFQVDRFDILNVEELLDEHVRQLMECIEARVKVSKFEEQLARDIPRCHQYHPVLNCTSGKRRLAKLLKAWNADPQNSKYRYWQGLDSICAPFVVLYENDGLAYSMFSRFVLRYIDKYCIIDDLGLMHSQWLGKFIQLLAFHDPELSAHLASINFSPHLYAVPWFLTMFSRKLLSS